MIIYVEYTLKYQSNGTCNLPENSWLQTIRDQLGNKDLLHVCSVPGHLGSWKEETQYVSSLTELQIRNGHIWKETNTFTGRQDSLMPDIQEALHKCCSND